MVVTSKHFDDLVLLAHIWPGKLPSELLTYYAPEVARRWRVTPADWYAFDLAATARWSELQREQQERQQEREQQRHTADTSAGARSTSQMPSTPTAAGTVRDQGDHLSIRGNEIPPWDSRYRAKAARPAS